MKICIVCNVEKDLSCFYKNKATKDKHQSRCKDCAKQYQRQWVDKNRDHVNKYNNKKYHEYTDEQKKNHQERGKIWLKNNPEKRSQVSKEYRKRNPEKYRIVSNRRRAAKKNNGVYLILEKEIKKILSSPCVICGSNENIHIDHIIPICRGGTHSIGNLQPLCSYHNLRKNSMLMKEYMIKLSKEDMENA